MGVRGLTEWHDTLTRNGVVTPKSAAMTTTPVHQINNCARKLATSDGDKPSSPSKRVATIHMIAATTSVTAANTAMMRSFKFTPLAR